MAVEGNDNSGGEMLRVMKLTLELPLQRVRMMKKKMPVQKIKTILLGENCEAKEKNGSSNRKPYRYESIWN